MAEAKRKRVSMTSPKGPFRYPKLTEPDYGNEKFPKPDGEYSVQLVLKADAKETKDFIKKLQPLYNKALENAEAEFKKLKVDARKKLGSVKPNDLFTTLYDKETEEPTGEISFKFAMKASGFNKKTEKKWTRKPAMFDAKGKPVVGVEVWSGTIGKVSFSVEEDGYFIPGTGAAGLKLSLDAAQIIELRQGGERDAAGYGFGAEDGFDGDTVSGRTSRFDDEDEGNTEDANTEDGNEASEDDF